MLSLKVLNSPQSQLQFMLLCYPVNSSDTLASAFKGRYFQAHEEKARIVHSDVKLQVKDIRNVNK